jgi:hypothetical protein
VELDHVAIVSVKRRVAIEDRLHPIFPRRNVSKALDGITQNGIIEDGGVPRSEPVDVDPEEWLSRVAAHHVETGLGVSSRREEKEDSAVHRSGLDRGGHDDLDAGSDGLCNGGESEG